MSLFILAPEIQPANDLVKEFANQTVGTDGDWVSVYLCVTHFQLAPLTRLITPS